MGMEMFEQASSQNASAFAESRSQEDDCMNENGKNAKTPKDLHQLNSKSNCLRSRLPQQPTAASANPPPSDAERERKPSPESTEQKMEKLEQATQQPTAASAHPPSSDAERESKPSPESTEQKMEKLEQASSKNASAFAESCSQEDDCMNENGKNAKTPVRASPGHSHQHDSKENSSSNSQHLTISSNGSN